VNPGWIAQDEFDRVVADAFETLPGWVREAMRDVAIMVEDEPPDGAGPEHGLLLGMYHGVPLTRRGARAAGSMPDSIVLYRQPILRAVRRRADVSDRVRAVLLHEIGHAMGMTEARLREMGVH
jgi:predicted Zn-dependent protease with MMP-like domain